MAQTVQRAALRLVVEHEVRGSGGLGAKKDTLQKILDWIFSHGTGAAQVNAVYTAERTLADGANEDLDLSGSLTDFEGTVLAFTSIKMLLIINKQADGTANTTNLTVTGKATNGFVSPFQAAGDGRVVKPGDPLLLLASDAAGYGVTATSADLLTITNGSGAQNKYQVIAWGTI